jgi:hypothetical protein
LRALVGWIWLLLSLVGAQSAVVERRISPEGGALQLPGITVTVPPQALNLSVRFRLERLRAVPKIPPQDGVFFIQRVPEREVVGIYRISSSATNFLRPIAFEVKVNPPFKVGSPPTVSAVYIWDGDSYVSSQVPSSSETFTQSRLQLGLGAGAGGYPAGLVVVVLRASEADLKHTCFSLGGRWTGSSCETR